MMLTQDKLIHWGHHTELWEISEADINMLMILRRIKLGHPKHLIDVASPCSVFDTVQHLKVTCEKQVEDAFGGKWVVLNTFTPRNAQAQVKLDFWLKSTPVVTGGIMWPNHLHLLRKREIQVGD